MLIPRSHLTALFIALANLPSLTATAAAEGQHQDQVPLFLHPDNPAPPPPPPHSPAAAAAAAAAVADAALLSDAGPFPLSTAAMSSSIARSAPLVFPAAGKHTATVIFAHGLGDTGKGWASAVENWRRRQRLDEVKFVLPHAPEIPITCNWGMRMPGWFDIKKIDGTVECLRESEDEPGMLASAEYFRSLVQAEVDAGIPSERVVLGGFSQGGAMAILAGLTGPHRIAGVVGLSTWLPLSDKFAGLAPADKPNQDTPVFLGHGTADPLVRPQLNELSAEALKKLGYKLTRKLYPGMPHAACPEELDDVEEFLRERLPPTQK
ncbi:hypothetical protein LX36DRAFT_655137 [Colletotrichum falcatum]|nr:hypothetical protein LX36DRAFT_655137 [Colletotrichum falcatum]